MDFLLDLLQGAGLAAAIGIRPFLPVLLAGALASADIGLDFDGTDFSFLESWPFLLGVLVLVVAARLRRPARRPRRRGSAAAALRAARRSRWRSGALARGRLGRRPLPTDWWAGAIAGLACAALGFQAARSLFGRVRRRLDEQAAEALPVYAEGAALVAAGVSILFPPLAILVIGALVWLLAGGRRRAGEKYAGLRILR